MKFDPTRAVALAGQFDAPRPLGSAGVRDASARVAGALREAGLTLLSPEAPRPGARRVRGVALAVFWVYLVLVALMGLPDGLWWAAVVGPTLLAAGLVALFRRNVRDRDPLTVIALRPAAAAPVARVVVLTGLESPVGVWVTAWQSACFLVVCFAGLAGLLPPLYHLIRARPGVGVGFVAVQWGALAALMISVRRWRGARRMQGDNRTGLALLVDLARTWPGSIDARAETLFVAAPVPAALPGAIASRLLDGRPTLFLTLDAPGVGPEIRVCGRGPAAGIAAGAARSLRLPHRIAHGAPADLGQASLRAVSRSCVAFCGRRGDAPIDPALLAAVAQLAVETALRWVKSVPLDPDRADQGGAMRARSSQKPG